MNLFINFIYKILSFIDNLSSCIHQRPGYPSLLPKAVYKLLLYILFRQAFANYLLLMGACEIVGSVQLWLL
ncbi:hypothetical protein AUC43_08140 [Hymenobacter sedentarius]|uniref:Uncharacterized protein n=1 Tax=Hymenobacter sedentarius TaxID=1411621 RepID=A0A0U4BNT4_9BACT|nr:hypothetical protein AUC43_08140 [Hymenobacter sedentarius]